MEFRLRSQNFRFGLWSVTINGQHKVFLRRPQILPSHFTKVPLVVLPCSVIHGFLSSSAIGMLKFNNYKI